MTRATAIIGANFGDEGKGLVTDYLVSQMRGDTVVVRFNGGAQAGHTVVTPEGVRHVFHSFGSGSLRGAATHLSRFFIVNPIVWKYEREELRQLCDVGRVTVAPNAPLTTPYDMLLNQETERLRGYRRHGSCGLGIHETLVRNEIPAYRTVAGSPGLRRTCEAIRKEWIGERLKSLNLGTPSDRFYERIHSQPLLEHYLEDVEAFLDATPRVPRIPSHTNVIFEGAQGLLLDEDHIFFPYVTHSKTGLYNVLTLCEENRIGVLDAIYVTRAYMTRHGAGPFPTEEPSLFYSDPTNAENEHQGKLRFGRLDPAFLADTIARDLMTPTFMPVHTSVAVTCLDQVADPDRILTQLRWRLPVGFVSYGPCHCDVRVVEKRGCTASSVTMPSA